MRRFSVSKDCEACGICFEITNLLVENETGYAEPTKTGYISDDYMNIAKSVVNACPAHAIDIVDVKLDSEINSNKRGNSTSYTLEQLPRLLEKRLMSTVIPEITKDDIVFDANKYEMNAPYSRGEGDFKYKSDEKAKKAGLAEFNQIVYSQYSRFILSVMVQYKLDKLKFFYSSEEDGFIAGLNRKYVELLQNFRDEAECLSNGKIMLPVEFVNFAAFPGGNKKIAKDCYFYALENFENIDMTRSVMENFHDMYHTELNDYYDQISWDYQDVKVEGLFGGSEFEERNCYYLNDAIDVYFSDLRAAMNRSDIDEFTLKSIESIIKNYKQDAEVKMMEKIHILENAIKNLGLKPASVNRLSIQNEIKVATSQTITGQGGTTSQQNYETEYLRIIEEKKAKLRQLTDDKSIIQNAYRTAFTDDEIIDLFCKGENTIFLCGQEFNVPLRKKKRFIGILGKPRVNVIPETLKKLSDKSIVFKNVQLPGVVDKDISWKKIQEEEIEEERKEEEIKKNKLHKKDPYYQYDLGVKYYADREYKKAFECFSNAAKLKLPQAQYQVGLLYLNGKVGQRDVETAIEWLTIAAKCNHVESECSLGAILKNGEHYGIETDIDAAVWWLKKAASQGSIEGLVQLIDLYYSGKVIEHRYEKEISELLLKGAEMGYENAQYCVGYRYLNGIGLPKDSQEGLNWLNKAISQGNDAAQCLVGQILEHENNFDISPNIDEAIKLLKLAADQENLAAIISLCRFYSERKESKQNRGKYIKFLEMAAKLGNVKAKKKLLGINITKLGVGDLSQQEIELLKKEAFAGDVLAQNKLGFCYCNGINVPVDSAQAMFWYRKAALQGDKEGEKNYYTLKAQQPKNYEILSAL